MSSNEATSVASGETSSDDWRSSVLQSYRNNEVKEIAKRLAALEPGATSSSKLMLAMRFEDAIFKAATSLVDYRKKISKRLKKLQKNYVPPAADASALKSKKDQLLVELRQEYGDPLRYISANSVKAVEEIRSRLGHDRAVQLQQHTDSAHQWALELGVLDKMGSAPPIAASWPEERLLKLKHHLERRVDNIRSYVVKHAEPDLFLQETLERKDKELPPRAGSMLGVNVSKRVEQLQGGVDSQLKTHALSSDQASGKTNQSESSASEPKKAKFDALVLLQESLEKAQAVVPPPTRNNSNDIPAALLHLDKMRAASSALLAYLALPDRTVAPREALTKSHKVAIEGINFIQTVTEKLKKSPNSILSSKKSSPDGSDVALEDAWTKRIDLPQDQAISDRSTTKEEGISDTLAATADEPLLKKPRLESTYPPAFKCRFLLAPKRKTPGGIVPALKRKNAVLVRPAPNGTGSHVILDFGSAFRMTIFFSPLLVTIRAQQAGDAGSAPTDSVLGSSACAKWTPLYHGLAGRKDLSVWGVNGNYASIGHVVEERLRDASTHATFVLRKCFANAVQHKTAPLDVEISEANALLEFVQLARRTYIPTWQDVN